MSDETTTNKMMDDFEAMLLAMNAKPYNGPLGSNGGHIEGDGHNVQAKMASRATATGTGTRKPLTARETEKMWNL